MKSTRGGVVCGDGKSATSPTMNTGPAPARCVARVRGRHRHPLPAKFSTAKHWHEPDARMRIAGEFEQSLGQVVES
jgi:hypothetical protein